MKLPCALARRAPGGIVVQYPAILLGARSGLPEHPKVEPILLAEHVPAGQPAIECFLRSALATRHGPITGATVTGKTITLQTMAANFGRIGVPVFMADVKGDLTGMTQAGSVSAKLAAILEERGIEPSPSVACPATLWDMFAGANSGDDKTACGAQGHPVHATVNDMGRLLLARMLALAETQQGVMQLVFRLADDNGLLRLDLTDLRAMLLHVGENASQFTTEHGNVSAASIGAIRAWPPADRRPGRRPDLRRADAEHRRLHANRRSERRSAWCHQHPRRPPADEESAAARHLPALDAERAVRTTARGR